MPPKNSIQHPLKVSLEDLYNGKMVKLAINRKVIVGDSNECATCHGQGGKILLGSTAIIISVLICE